MPVVRRLTRIGNSRGVIVPQPVLEQLNWGEDSEVEIRVKGNTLIIEPHRYATDEQFAAASKKVMAKNRKAFAKLAKS